MGTGIQEVEGSIPFGSTNLNFKNSFFGGGLPRGKEFFHNSTPDVTETAYLDTWASLDPAD
jgi:hypothetical protein